MANAYTWRWFIGFLGARREGAFIPLFAAALCAVTLTAISCASPFRAASPGLALMDISKWGTSPTGEPVRVGTAKRDPATGKIVERHGDTEGIVDDPTLASAPAKPATQRPDSAAELYRTAAFIGVISRWVFALCAIVAIASFFVPVLIVHRAAILKSFGIGLALILVQFWINQYGVALAVVSFWVTIATAVGALVAFGYPLVRAWVRKQTTTEIKAKGLALAENGDAHGGAAIVIAASPPEKFAKPGAKSALKAALGVAAGGAD